ncbi:MAG: FHA domain-containing protein [Phenylobacterium sp.]|uniref:FHA domain-containing protein n=1 Tax=Phenylobacterium sp. TaxID=1871053 RepID=UPI001A45AC3B|nr:FHA domain-containing protein [Phenylobacterium sp.]MBL8773723.1 FHA domain-containing protein [Phenylobacterium sp.]
MAQDFQLKLITERAGGGDPIVRERRVEGPQASIGRGADNDIVLADLSVDPIHARLRFTGPGRVSIEAATGLTVEVNGKAVPRADLSAASRPVVRIASYTLAFEPGEGEGVVITVTREADERHLTPSVFSLQSRVFGRRNMAWAFGSGIFLVCLLVPLLAVLWFNENKLIHPDEQWSSGPLSTAHAFLESDCKSCHANAFVAVRDDACLSCHQAGESGPKALARAKEAGSPFQPLLVVDHAPRERLSKGTPLPDGIGAKISTVIQRAVGHPTDRCASCHIEHTKPTAKPVDAAAPLTDKPTLVVVNDCQSCHARLKMRLSDTELVDTPDWNRHPAFKPLIMTAAGPKPQFQRVALTSGPQERNGLTFPHRMHMDPRGGVARQAIELGKAAGYGSPLDCGSCHEAKGVGFRPIEMEKDCGTCHSLAYARNADGSLKLLPHGELQKVVDTLAGRTLAAPGGAGRERPGTIRPTMFAASGASAYRATFSPGGTCYDCHSINWEGDVVKMAPVKLTQRYMPRGAFDHSIAEHGALGKTGKAGAFKCADCHKAQTSDRASDVLVPDLAKCSTCHGQPTSKIAAADDADCTTCHAFHQPGEATPKPGHPPLNTLRWTQMMSRRPGA